MIYEVKVHRNTVLFPLVGHYLVDASSGELAANYALAKARKDYASEGKLHVTSVRELDGQFIGSAAQLQRALDGAKAPRKSRRSAGSPRK